jgi:glutamate/tyrosine decarboxylase-like PLP-dependent enzyme
LRKKIQNLESIALALEPGSAERGDWVREVNAYAERFLAGLDSAQTYVPDGGMSDLLSPGVAEQPESLAGLLAELEQSVDGPGINPASGGHMGYIPGGGIYPSSLGDFLADVTNRYSGVAFASPGAARMEALLIDWMAELVGYPAAAGGDLTSGGSIANLTGIVTAREAMDLKARDVPDGCIYLSEQVHHCVAKALRVAGLKECPRRIVPMDSRYRMNPAALHKMIRDDRQAGLKPWLVVASAGTTDTGAVDPLPEIAAITSSERLWLHVDAAYGGFFLLCSEGREVLKGMDAPDSIVMDPHKGLFLPYGTGAVLVRDVTQLARAHTYQANYMQDATRDSMQLSPADLSAELSRPFRGMRLWLPLKLFGLAVFRAALAEKIWLARYFHERISSMPGFEAGPYPDLSVVTYRYVPEHGDANEFNRRMLQAVHDDGRVFITSTMIGNRFTLRLAVLHFRTHLATIDYLLDLLERKARELNEN